MFTRSRLFERGRIDSGGDQIEQDFLPTANGRKARARVLGLSFRPYTRFCDVRAVAYRNARPARKEKKIPRVYAGGTPTGCVFDVLLNIRFLPIPFFLERRIK